MPDAPQIKSPPRNELTALAGINERVMRYLEGLSSAITDTRTQTGTGSPEGVTKSNSSRLYIDLATGDLYKNTASTYGSITGWALV